MAFVQVRSPLGGVVPVEVGENPPPPREEVERAFWQFAEEVRRLPGGEEVLARYEELARARYLAVRDAEVGSLAAGAREAREEVREVWEERRAPAAQLVLAKAEYSGGEMAFAYGEVDGGGVAGMVFLKRQEAGDVDPVLFRTDGENLYVAASRRTISPGEGGTEYLVESLPLEEVRGLREASTLEERAALAARHIAEELGREPLNLVPMGEREAKEVLTPVQEVREGGVVLDDRGNPVGAYDLVIELRDLNGDGRVEPAVTKVRAAAVEFGEVGGSWAFSESMEARQVREGLRSPGQDEETLGRYDPRVEERLREEELRREPSREGMEPRL